AHACRAAACGAGIALPTAAAMAGRLASEVGARARPGFRDTSTRHPCDRTRASAAPREIAPAIAMPLLTPACGSPYASESRSRIPRHLPVSPLPCGSAGQSFAMVMPAHARSSPARRAAKSRSAPGLDPLPEWNLADLYAGIDDPRVKRDLDR